MVGRSRVIFILFAVVVVTLCQSSRQVSARLDGEVVVEIQNILDPSRADLQVQCLSGDDNLHNHIVEFGNTYNFTFENNVWDTTLFFCCFQWEKPDHVWLQGGPYNIYMAKRDQERCMHYCRWRVEEEDLYP
ncbi:hypothetical protein D8674_028600 [Pyrus ussuriensis x Pyrus communis]|uniref:S-protein homolog n=1 Tax=Pyrus ussuriensis x Pyrus communis TaxID=2448454 RepID=A0A5N5HZR5_9ROSA|nr:hypothetical protein D8674_028600 [Pyrus ussuriensis x Pyrus communis]